MCEPDKVLLRNFRGVLLVATLVFGFGFSPPGVSQQDPEQNQSSQENGKRVKRLRDSLAVDPNQEWVPGADRRDRSEEIERKLSLGERALAAGELLQPLHDNALEYFNAALAIDSEQVRARQGIAQVVAALLNQARAALEAGDSAGATQLLDSVKAIEPDHADLAEFENQLARRNQLDSLLQTAQNLIRAQQLILPKDSNAMASLNAAAGIDPLDPRVLEGLAEVRALLVTDAVSISEADNFGQAYDLLKLAAAIDGPIDQITEARAVVLESQQRYWQGLAEDLATIIAGGELDQAELDLETLATSGFSGPELEQLRNQLTTARLLRDYPAKSTFSDAFVSADGRGPQMVVIGKGEFTIGSPPSERGRKDKEGPQQQIRFEHSFALAVTEITVGQFRQFVAATQYLTDVEQGGNSTAYNVDDGSLGKVTEISWRRDYENKLASDNLPVIHVSWHDVTAYLAWLTELTGKNYRLASESEFEYSLRAGAMTRYWWGDGSPKEQVENLTGQRDTNSGQWQWPNAFRRYGDGHWGPAPVATYLSNANGVHDLGGNVMEWLADCYVPTLEGIPLGGSPRSDSSCEMHVVKGASWVSPPDLARSAYRSSAKSASSSSFIGFRVARDL